MDRMTKDIETALRGRARRPCPADWTRALAERAAAEGLLDVAYASVDSPLGPLLVAATPRGLVRLAYASRGRGAGGPGPAAVAARPGGARAPGRRPPRAGRVLRRPPRRVRPADRLVAHRRLRRQGAAPDRADRLRADEHLRRGRRRAPAARARCAPRATRSAPTRCRSSCPATACCARAERWAATPGGRSARSSCCAWRAYSASPPRLPSGLLGEVAEWLKALAC